MGKRGTALLAGLLAISIAAGCGDSSSTTTTTSTGASSSSMASGDSSTTQTASEKPATETGAATLRANLTSLLEEHVYLAGIAVSTGVSSGLTSPAFKASAAALDTNSVALSEAIGSVYGQQAAKGFLALWRKHIGMFVDYTKGLATKNTKLAAKALKDLDSYRSSFANFLHSANPNISVQATAESLQMHVQTLSAAIRSVVAGKSDAFDKLRLAAQHMPDTATYLAGAIAKQQPGKFDGDVKSPASELRSGLTNLLLEHVYLAGIAVNEGVTAGLTSPAFKAAAATLDANTKDLAGAIGSVYGGGAQKRFLQLWRAHIGFFVEYTKGLATHDRKATAAAQNKLNGYRAAFADFLHSANPNIDADATAMSLQEHVKTLSAAIRAVVSGSPMAFARLRTAAQHMPMTADYLAGAIAKQQKLA